jgi:enoyl-CoA hydratase/carnithine racemase
MNATLEKEPVVDELPAAEPRMIKRSVTEDHICVLAFDRPDSAANVFDKATLVELNEHLDFIASNPQFKGIGHHEC